MPFNLFKFLEQFMSGTFSIKLTQFEETGLMGDFSYFAGKSEK